MKIKIEDTLKSKKRKFEDPQMYVETKSSRVNNNKKMNKEKDNQEDYQSTPKRHARFRSNLEFFRKSESNSRTPQKPPTTDDHVRTRDPGTKQLQSSKTTIPNLRQFLDNSNHPEQPKALDQQVPSFPNKSAPNPIKKSKSRPSKARQLSLNSQPLITTFAKPKLLSSQLSNSPITPPKSTPNFHPAVPPAGAPPQRSCRRDHLEN